MSRQLLTRVCLGFLVFICLSCEDHLDVPSGRFRTKSITYQKTRYGSFSSQQDVFIYDINNRLDSSKSDVFGSKGLSIRKPIITYAYDDRGRLASFDYRYYQQLDILYMLGFVRTFTYSQDGTKITVKEVNHDPSLNTYTYDLFFNAANQLISGSSIYQNDNLIQEDRILVNDRVRYLYEYDNKPNPFYRLEGYPEYLTSWRRYSKNNLKKVTVQVLAADSNTIISSSSFNNTLTYDEKGLLIRMAGGDQSYYNTNWDYQEFTFRYEPY